MTIQKINNSLALTNATTDGPLRRWASMVVPIETAMPSHMTKLAANTTNESNLFSKFLNTRAWSAFNNCVSVVDLFEPLKVEVGVDSNTSVYDSIAF